MNDDTYTPNARIIGGLISLIIIAIVLFKFNLAQTIQSPEFKKGVNRFENKSIFVLNTYIISPSEYFWAVISTEFQELLGEEKPIPNPVSNWQLPSINIDINQNNQEVYQISKPVNK